MPRGELSSGAVAKRHPLDWYVEEQWVTRQLIDALGGFRVALMRGETIWDPACGLGNIGAAFGELAAFGGGGHSRRLMLSDVVRRIDAEQLEGVRFDFAAMDFLESIAPPNPVSIVCNPPYSYRKGAGRYAGQLISEAFARHALRIVAACGGTYVAMVLPVKWLASQARWRLFSDHPPSAVLHLTQRPSMPPGDRIAEMGARAFRGGMVDYWWIVWDVRHPAAPGETRTIWLPPLGRPVPLAPLPGLTTAIITEGSEA
ncbi:hypothetical protein ACFQ1E_08155 [Sphingomonas canadensis]|uniref:Methyltransferase n=1 Tax=Sphingomonas canadensis TaxID=1219257 RepID=A0ABW3H7D6_9SPHN|nr:hypothetical protein [Sphingomonas canadensis]MCW3836009.1 hypothetical protein [Sphingomonas canadensis]